MSKINLYNYGKQHLLKGLNQLSKLCIDKAKGCYVHDSITNQNYLDLTSGIAVTSTGHCHPKVVQAIQQQAEKLIHAQTTIHLHEPMINLIQKFQEIMPYKQFNQFALFNTGAEAVENAIKVAKSITQRNNIITFQGGFHGRSFGTMGLTSSKKIYRQGFGPFLNGIYTLPYPYKSQLDLNWDENQCTNFCLNQLDLLLKQQVDKEEIACILIEPILGEGGYVPANKEFLKGLKERCESMNCLLLIDEVQSGFGRTGKYFAIEYSSVLPDILIMAKGIASGMPLSGIALNDKIKDSLKPGSLGGTYIGNPISCAAALATIQVIEEENLLNNVNLVSDYIMNRLNKELTKLVNNKGYLVDIRGKGFMIGIEFYKKDLSINNNNNNLISSKIVEYCLKELNLLIMNTSIFDTLRLMPPLILNLKEAELLVNQLLIATEKCLN